MLGGAESSRKHSVKLQILPFELQKLFTPKTAIHGEKRGGFQMRRENS